MAAIALPILALGGIYIYSNSYKNNNKENKDKKDKKEGYQNLNRGTTLTNTTLQDINYPTESKTINLNNENSVRQYNPSQTNNVFFNRPNATSNATNGIQSLSGELLSDKEFTHKNMVPFFGSKVTQNSVENTPYMLDTMTGSGSQTIKKIETAPLFKPETDIQYAHGAPNQTDFIRSRQVPSQKYANVLPWQQERVGPGLGLGYTNEGEGGFNAGMLNRNSWMPPSVDELRTITNPKISYTLNGHEGAPSNIIKNLGTIGNVEKNRPDQAYSMGPEHWFTTTGNSIGQTAQPQQMLPDTNNLSKEYFGSGTNTTNQGIYTKSIHEESHKTEASRPVNLNPAVSLGQNSMSDNDYGVKGFTILNNNRSENIKHGGHNDFGNVTSFVKGMFAPILDVIKPTRKEDVIHNANQLGNVQCNVPKLPLTNPSDQLKTTTKETTIDKVGLNYLNVSHINTPGGAYEHSTLSAKSQQRNFGDSSSSGNIGNTSATNAQMDITAWSNQHNNVNKTYENWPMAGGTQLYSGSMNMNINRRDNDRVNNRLTADDFIRNVPVDNSLVIPSIESVGQINIPQQYNSGINVDRMDPSLLQAFKSNPYTKSLNSY
jgi:hypothetical protein